VSALAAAAFFDFEDLDCFFARQDAQYALLMPWTHKSVFDRLASDFTMAAVRSSSMDFVAMGVSP